MSNPSKRKGTRGETAVVEFLRVNGFPHAERRALQGTGDKGDIAGVVGVTFEVKNTNKVTLAAWVAELAAEMANARTGRGAVVAARRGTADVGQWYAIQPFGLYIDLLRDAGHGDPR